MRQEVTKSASTRMSEAAEAADRQSIYLQKEGPARQKGALPPREVQKTELDSLTVV